MRTIRALAIFVSAMAGPATAAPPEPPKQLFILTSSAPETQALALILANRTAAAGANVELLLCDGAGDVALASPPAAAGTSVTPDGTTVRRLLDMLIEKKATVHLCAIYLPNRKLAATALMPGVTPTRPERIAGLMLDPAIRVFAF